MTVTNPRRGISRLVQHRLTRASSAAQHAGIGAASLLPSHALELGLVGLALGIAEAEIADQPPSAWNVEDAVHARWLENGYPPHPDALPPRRKPQHAYGGDDRVLGHLGHGSSTEAVADLGRALREHRELARCLL